jgi:hypothetical protein
MNHLMIYNRRAWVAVGVRVIVARGLLMKGPFEIAARSPRGLGRKGPEAGLRE